MLLGAFHTTYVSCEFHGGVMELDSLQQLQERKNRTVYDGFMWLLQHSSSLRVRSDFFLLSHDAYFPNFKNSLCFKVLATHGTVK